MLKSRVIKTAYTGLSLIDIGFSGRILEKYGLFSDNYLTGVSMIFRKDKARGRTGSTAVYRNIFNRTFVFRFLSIGRNCGIVSTNRSNEAGDIFSPRYNSHSLDNYIPKLIPLSGQIEASGGVDREPIGPGFKYITAWYLNLQRYIKPETFISLTGYQTYPSVSEDRIWLAHNGAGSNILFRRGEGRSVGRWAGTKSMESVIPPNPEPKQVQYITRTEAGSMFSRSLGRHNIGRLNYTSQLIKSEIFNIVRKLHTEFMNYKTEKHPVDNDVTSFNNLHEVSDRFSTTPDNLKPGYLKEYGSGKQLAEYHSWLEWYQSSRWKRIQRAGVQLAFERQVLENHRQKLTNTLRRLSLEISKNETGRQLQESEQSLADRSGRSPYLFTYMRGRLGEKTRLKQELQRILDAQASKEKLMAGDTRIPEEQLHSSSSPGGSGNDRMLGEAGISDTIQLPGTIRGQRDSKRGISTVTFSKPGSELDKKMLESERYGINGGPLNLTEPGLGTGMVLLKNMRGNRLLYQERFRETAIVRKEQELRKVLEIQDYMNLQWRRFKSETGFSFNIKSILLKSSQNIFDKQDNQQMKDVYLINRTLDSFSKTHMLAESLSKLEELIRYEYRQQPKPEIQTSKLKKGGTLDKRAISKTELYKFQTKTTDGLSTAGLYPGESHTLPGPQYRKSRMSRRLIAEVMELGKVIQSYQEKKSAIYRKEIRRQAEFWKEIESGVESAGNQPEFKQISKGQARFRLYTKQAVPAEENEWKESRYLEQDKFLDYEYNSNRFPYKPTKLGSLKTAGLYLNESGIFPGSQHKRLSMPSRFLTELIELGQVIQSYQEKKNALYRKEIQRQNDIWKEIESGGAGDSKKQPVFKQIPESERRFRLYTKQTVRAEEEEWEKTRYLKQANIQDYVYNSERFRQKSTNLSTELWDRVRYKQKVIKQWNNSELSTLKIQKNGRTKTRSSIKQIRKISQLDNDTRNTPQVPISTEELGINHDIITKGNMHLYQIKGSQFKISQNGSEFKRLHRIMPGIDTAISVPEEFIKYSPMDFHRQMREPDSERNTAKAQNEEVINDQVYRYEGEIKIDQANMERIVNNVYNEIERRLEFERQRRGL